MAAIRVGPSTTTLTTAAPHRSSTQRRHRRPRAVTVTDHLVADSPTTRKLSRLGTDHIAVRMKPWLCCPTVTPRNDPVGHPGLEERSGLRRGESGTSAARSTAEGHRSRRKRQSSAAPCSSTCARLHRRGRRRQHSGKVGHQDLQQTSSSNRSTSSVSVVCAGTHRPQRYGASAFSDWLNPDAAFAQTTRPSSTCSWAGVRTKSSR